ncbi:MAG: Fe-S-binding domain-containing protein [Actinomycetota bacterium]|nr:Fe-S-binding domain-containing protein [Actinomycetota bacterium]
MTDAGLASLLPLTVAIPITGAVAAPLLGRVSKRLPLVVSVVAMTGTAAVLGLLAPRVYGGRVLTHFMGHWGPFDGQPLGIAFGADPFGLTYALVTAVLGALLLLYTLSELGGLGKRELGGYACLFQLLLAALIGTALTADLFNMFVWFEVAALSSYGLTGFFLERPLALEAAFKVLVLTTLASFAVFLGAALVYSGHGALNLGHIHTAVGDGLRTADLVALGLLVTGFATKAGLVPFHGWLPDAHTAAPGPVSALFSGLMVNLGIVAIARLTLQVYAGHGRPVLGLLTVLGLVSAVGGALLALAQDDLKRLLAYDTVSQMGVLAVGVGTASPVGLAGTTYHLLSHALFKALLFLCAGAIVHSTGLTKLSEMGGLARRRPVVAAAFVVAALSISGVPPMNGYVSLGLVHDALRSTHPVVFATMLLAQVITIAALARAAYLAFFRRRPEEYGDLARLHPGMLTAFGTLAAGCVGFGLVPGFMLRHVAAPAAASLTDGATYSRAVLAGGARLAVPRIPFDYLAPAELLTVVGTVLAGLALAWWYLRHSEPRVVRGLRALHNGSVNDYAAYATLGAVVTVTTVLVG